MITDYLEDEVSLSLLSLSDVIVYPYQLTQESSSAAIRHGIVTGKPVVCTPLSIFDDVKPIVHFLPGISPKDIFLGLDALFRDERILLSKNGMQKEWIKNHNWKVISHRLQNVIRALVENKRYVS
jgi:glycosyltransferase involved in cell wall biosynthesis